jgi:GNAT superfamily N-acetyltransferase
MDPTAHEIRIRPAQPQDAEPIAEMIHELAAFERQPRDCHATTARVTEQLFTTRPTAAALIAERGSEVAGFALYFFNFSTWECAPGLYLEDLYVRPAHRHQGVGRRLFLQLGAIARERGCHRLELAVLDWNQHAIDFYADLGAEPMDEWTIHRISGDALERLKLGVGIDGEEESNSALDG